MNNFVKWGYPSFLILCGFAMLSGLRDGEITDRYLVFGVIFACLGGVLLVVQAAMEFFPKPILNRTNDREFGWRVRVIEAVDGSSVQLDDGVSFIVPYFKDAVVGDIWAVHHVRGFGCFGKVDKAILLQRAKTNKDSKND